MNDWSIVFSEADLKRSNSTHDIVRVFFFLELKSVRKYRSALNYVYRLKYILWYWKQKNVE